MMPIDTAKPRIAARKKLFTQVEASYLGRPLRLHLLDISNSGALAHCTTPLVVDTVIRLAIGDYTSLVRIKWQRDGRIGLSLTNPLNDDMIEHALAMRSEEARQPLSAVG